MELIKSRQLILMGNQEKCFVDTPGWLYHYEPFGVDIFIHHVIVPRGTVGFYMERYWKVSDVCTGLSLSNGLNGYTRELAVELVCDRLSTVTLSRYNETVLEWLAKLPPHKASWRFDKIKYPAVEVKE